MHLDQNYLTGMKMEGFQKAGGFGLEAFLV